MLSINKKYRIMFLIILIIMFVIIFLFSGQKGEDSSQLSEGMAIKIVNIIFSDYDRCQQIEIANDLYFWIRKAAHFLLYFIVGADSLLFLSTYDIKIRLKIGFSILLVVLYSASDEIHQLFVPGRDGNIIDVFIDLCGALIGIALVFGIFKLCLKIKNKDKIN